MKSCEKFYFDLNKISYELKEHDGIHE